MLLHRVKLRNFRSLVDGTLDLIGLDSKPVRVMALIGPNGSGKTAWLDAIAGFFTELVPEYGGERLTPSDVRDEAGDAEVCVVWGEGTNDHDGALEVSRKGKLGRFWEGGTRGVRRRFILGDGGFEREREGWARLVAESPRDSTGVLIYFDAHRFAPRATLRGPDATAVVTHRVVGALAPSLSASSQGGGYRFDRLRQWIVNLEFARARAKADRGETLPAWEHLIHALDSMLEPCRFERVTENFEVLFRTPTGVVPIERLSSGYQSVLVIVTELLLRLSLATEDPSRLFDIDAVCLIDEIDAHLHPLWEERILGDLRRMFPRVQFIVTTHSEYVVAGLEPHEVSVLREEGAR